MKNVMNKIMNKVFIVFLCFVCVAVLPAFAEDSLKISKIYIHSKDAFDDAKINTPIEAKLYSIGNYLHINTRESVIKARLPFKENSFVKQSQLPETEKNLRSLAYLSDAKISTKTDSLGNTDLYVETSDNWTLSPTLSLGKPGEEWLYSIGILENNLLGLGHSVGFFFEHGEDRDQKYLLYNTKDFFIPYHSFNFLWSENSDGFYRSLEFGYPFISRLKNQWAYNAKILWSKRNEKFYESKITTPIETIEGLKEDSLQLHLSRSFGGSSFKTYLGITYDFNRIKSNELLGSDAKWQDSRVGFSLAASRIKLDKKYNLHKAKWAEDVERGYYIKTLIAKNFKALEAANNDFYFEQNINLSLGINKHNLLAKGQNYFYYNNDSIRDMHSMIFGEYIFKPSLEWSSILSAQIDSWQRTTVKRQLYLDGNTIFPGFPAYYLAGENTFAFKAEQRYFTGKEIFTLVPSLAAFLTAGEATNELHSFDPHNLIYMAGVGIRFSNSKSVTGTVTHINLSWALNDDKKKSFVPRFSFVGKLEL